MNFGKKGLQNKINNLESNSNKVGKWAGVAFIRAGLVIIIALAIFFICFMVGSYRAIIDNAPSISDVNIIPNGYATFIYDSNGVELQKLNSAEGNRVSVSINEIPMNMQHAIVAIEDSRFYRHNGIDRLGMIRAAAVAVSTGFQRTEGASTITQQLLKNNVFTEWTTETGFKRIVRKLQEQHLATLLETALTIQGVNAKDVILENYLNTVNFGGGAYGVQTASQTYFGKDCPDLTLSECAVLAAIPQNPTRYNPYRNPEENKDRQQVVLDYMLDQEYITKDEYKEAVSDDVYSRIKAHVESSEENFVPYSYFIDEVIEQVEKDLIEIKGYTEVQAVNAVYSSGLSIMTTQDSYIQSVMEDEFSNEANFPERVTYALDWALTVDHANGERQHYSREMLQLYFRGMDPEFDLIFDSEDSAKLYVDAYKAYVVGPDDEIVAERFSATKQPQAAMVVMDQTNGHVLGIVGGRGVKTASLTLNRATDSYRQPGSTFKPISTYGPAMELGYINLSTRVMDEPYNYDDGTPINNADRQFHGNVTIRESIIRSYNVVAVKILSLITPQMGFNFLTDLGFSNLINDTEWDVIQPLALGGVTNGVTTLELCGAYAALANKGVYTEPVFYTKVYDHDGNLLLEKTPIQNRVFRESTAFLLTSAMMDVVTVGTGMDFAVDNMPLAGKTGTTNIYRDLVFAGYTPYYTGAIWAGADVSAELSEDYRSYHKTLWRNIMNRIHEGKPYAGFAVPSTVTNVRICSETGLLVGEGCTPAIEYFDISQVPAAECMAHKPTPTPTPTPKPTTTPAPAQPGAADDAVPGSNIPYPQP